MLKRGRKQERSTGALVSASAEHRAEELAASLREKEQLLERERRLRSELEAASRAREKALALLAHDLRGPVSAVLGWTGLLRSDCLDAAARERALASIDRCARAQGELITSLLDVSRLTAGRMPLAVGPVDLAELARSSVDELLPAARAKGIDLLYEGGHAIVVGDAARLRQVVANLLANAVKFTGDGGRVTVSISGTPRGFATLEVKDTGVGIPPVLLPHVFECFRQGGAPGLRRAGLGLGLYIVKELVHMHGGSVSATSGGEGKGATFAVRLPAEEARQASEVPPAASSGRILITHDELAGMRILLVEDEPDTRDVLAVALRANGAEVVTTHDAKSALAVFPGVAPDLLISDISLPEMDGHELMRRVRAKSAVPSIAVSGFVTPDDERRSHAAGFDAHLAKPFTVRQLVSTVWTVAHDLRVRRPA